MLVDINLLPEKERERSGFLYAALGVIGAALLVWLVFFLLARAAAEDTERLDGQLVGLQATQAELSSQLDRPESAQARDRLAASVQWAEAYRYETAPLLEELTAELPRRGFFRSFAFAAPHQATVEVQFDDKTEAAYYLTRLLASASVETASIESIAAEETEEREGTDGAAAGSDKAVRVLPRYIATYTVLFTDPRATLDGAAPAVPEEDAENEEETTDDEQPQEDIRTEEEGADAQPD